MKRILSIALVVLMIATLSVGCAKKEAPLTLLDKAFNQSAALASLTSDMTLSAQVQANEAMLALDPSVKTTIDMISAGKITATMASDTKKGNMNGKLSLDTNGMAIAMELYMKDFAQMILKTPMAEKYITMDLGGAAQEPVDLELMKKVNQEASAVFVNLLKEEYLTTEYKVPFEGKDGKVDLNYVTITMDNAQFIAFVKEVIPALYASESLKQLMSDSVTNSMETAGQEVTPEEVQKQIDESMAQLPTMLDQMQENISFDSVTIKVGIDKDYNTRDMDMDFVMTAKDGEASMNIALKVETEYYAFNQPVAATDIEITEENSMPFEELLMQLMFGGMGM